MQMRNCQYQKIGGEIVDNVRLSPFGKQIKKRLVDLDRPQFWLIDEVRKKTGLYFDRSYMHKIQTGQAKNPKIIGAIQEILELKGGDSV